MQDSLKELHGIYTYQSSFPFFQGITKILLEAINISQDPSYLSSYTILVPTERSKRTLTQTFLQSQKEKGNNALLLPTIFTLGEIPKRPVDFLKSLYSSSFREEILFKNLPQSFSSKEFFFLCWKIAQQASSSFEEQLALAQSLYDFLDLLHSERTNPKDIFLSVHGKSSLYEEKCLLFWDILKDIWPYFESSSQPLSPAQFKSHIFSSIAQVLNTHTTDQRVMVLGPQGIFPGSKAFLKSILSLPKGAIVLDPVTSLSLEAYQKEPSHFPEFWLFEQRHLLEFLNVEPSSLLSWPLTNNSSRDSDTLSLFIKGLQTNSSADTSFNNLAPVLFFEGNNLFDQARYIALKMRQILTHPTKTAALITPSRTLAQAVREELKRWDIFIDDSLGVPLSQTKAGTLLLLLCSILKDSLCPLTFLSLLKHSYSFLFSSQASYQKSLFVLETYALRGIPPKSFLSLKERITSSPQLTKEDLSEIINFLDLYEKTILPLSSFSPKEKIPLTKGVHVLYEAFLAITASFDPESAGDITEILLFLETLLSESTHSPSLLPYQIPFLLRKFLEEQSYRDEKYDHPRLSIWGCAESRLLKKDVFILGDVNEGYWPKLPSSNPWITPELLETLGLSLYQKEKGEMAHDFAHALLAPEIIITSRKKDAPNLLDPSCFYLYLKYAFETIKKPLRLDEEGATLLQNLASSHKDSSPPSSPSSNPPLYARPRELSVSDVSLLRKDPYGFYAKKILRLLPTDPFLYEPGAQDFGNLLHSSLEFFTQNPTQSSVSFFLQQLEINPLFLSLPSFKQKSWKERFYHAFLFFEKTHKERIEGFDRILCEHPLVHTITLGSRTPFSLKGRIDRLEIGKNRYTISDYKTGSLPSITSIQEGYAPQLPLLGFLVKSSIGFETQDVIDLCYWHFGKNPSLVSLLNPNGLIEEAKEGLYQLLSLYFSNDHISFKAAIEPYSPYNHLKRTKEWAGPLSVFYSSTIGEES